MALAWLLKAMGRCLLALEVYRAVLVDMVVQTICRVVTVALQALAATLLTTSLVTTVATRPNACQPPN